MQHDWVLQHFWVLQHLLQRYQAPPQLCWATEVVSITLGPALPLPPLTGSAPVREKQEKNGK